MGWPRRCLRFGLFGFASQPGVDDGSVGLWRYSNREKAAVGSLALRDQFRSFAERIFFQQGRVARLRLSRQKRFAHSRSKQGRGALETSKITWLRVPVFSGIQVSLTAVFSDIPSLSLPVRYPL